MKQKLELFKRPLVQHVIFWIIYFTFDVARWSFYYNDFNYSLQINLVGFSIHLILVYANIYYIIPKYLRPRKFGLYSAALLATIISMSLVRVILTQLLFDNKVWVMAHLAEVDFFNLNYIVTVFVEELYVVTLTASIILAVDWAKSMQLTKKLKNKKLRAELAFLQSQVQPHFFFNTLNNLYYLTLTKSDKAPETVLKLSDLMSYVIYKGRQKQVSLLEEIGHIQDFIDLERLHYGASLEFNLNISGNVEEKYIPPLILQPCVENSFKHGVVDDANILSIDIDLKVEGNILSYSVENQRSTAYTKSQHKSSEHSGIGIQNTKRRLNLLYKNDYSIDIIQTDSKYQIKLKIPLYDKMPHS